MTIYGEKLFTKVYTNVYCLHYALDCKNVFELILKSIFTLVFFFFTFYFKNNTVLNYAFGQVLTFNNQQYYLDKKIIITRLYVHFQNFIFFFFVKKTNIIKQRKNYSN